MEVRRIQNDELYHHGIKGQKWGVRRYQNPDGSLTAAGRKRYYNDVQKIVNTSTTFKERYEKIATTPVYETAVDTIGAMGLKSGDALYEKKQQMNKLVDEFNSTEDKWVDKWADDMVKTNKQYHKGQSDKEIKEWYKNWYKYDDGGQNNGPVKYYLESKGFDKHQLENEYFELEKAYRNDIKKVVDTIINTNKKVKYKSGYEETLENITTDAIMELQDDDHKYRTLFY